MPTLKNLSYGAVTFGLGRERTVTLRKGETVEVTAAQPRLKEVKQLLDERKLIVMPDTGKKQVSQSF